MPKTKQKAVPRKTIRIAKPIMDEADRIVRETGLYCNRQQFIESAIREKVEKFKFAEDREVANPGSEQRITTMPHEIDEGFLVHIRETLLAHTVINIVKEKTMPAHHSDQKQLEQLIRRHIARIAGREGQEITEERLDKLTEELLVYHKEMLEGLSLMASH